MPFVPPRSKNSPIDRLENLCSCIEPRSMSIGIVHHLCDGTGRLQSWGFIVLIPWNCSLGHFVVNGASASWRCARSGPNYLRYDSRVIGTIPTLVVDLMV